MEEEDGCDYFLNLEFVLCEEDSDALLLLSEDDASETSSATGTDSLTASYKLPSISLSSHFNANAAETEGGPMKKRRVAHCAATHAHGVHDDGTESSTEGAWEASSDEGSRRVLDIPKIAVPRRKRKKRNPFNGRREVFASLFRRLIVFAEQNPDVMRERGLIRS